MECAIDDEVGWATAVTGYYIGLVPNRLAYLRVVQWILG